MQETLCQQIDIPKGYLSKTMVLSKFEWYFSIIVRFIIPTQCHVYHNIALLFLYAYGIISGTI